MKENTNNSELTVKTKSLKSNIATIEIKKFIDMINTIKPFIIDTNMLYIELGNTEMTIASGNAVIQSSCDGNIDDKSNHAITINSIGNIKMFIAMMKALNMYDTTEDKSNKNKLQAYFAEISLIKDNVDMEIMGINFQVVSKPIAQASLFPSEIEYINGISYRYEASYCNTLNIKLDVVKDFIIPNLNMLSIPMKYIALMQEGFDNTKDQIYCNQYIFNNGIVWKNKDFTIFLSMKILKDIAEKTLEQEDIENPLERFAFKQIIQNNKEEVIARLTKERPDLLVLVDKLEDRYFIKYKRVREILENMANDTHELESSNNIDTHADTIDKINGFYY